MSPNQKLSFLVFGGVVIVLVVTAIQVLKSRGHLSRETYITCLASAWVAIAVGEGTILRLPLLGTGILLALTLPAFLASLLRIKWLTPRVWRTPGGANIDGLSWDEPGLFAVLRAEDPLMIAGQEGEDAVYMEAAHLLDSEGPALSLSGQLEQLTDALGRAVEDPGLVIPREVRRVAKILRRLAATASNAESSPVGEEPAS
ncbi:MAG: hypothetical protein HGA39_09645 [Coriobacteriia bacterium]|nr:hypothetical protein [Coriobacteriia bacterium]